MPDGPTPKPRAYSFSAFDTFDTCLRLYYGKYEARTLPYKETPQIKDGNRKHQAFHLRVKGNIALPDNLARWEPFIQQVMASGAVDAESDTSIARDLRPVDFFASDVFVRSRQDLILLGTTAACIWDYKTGNSAYEKPLQLEIGALGVFSRFRQIQKVSVANVWLKDEKMGEVRTYTRERDMKRIAEDVFYREGRIDAARKANAWPAMESPLCKWCEDKACPNNRNKE